jgi:hypothetical protein
MAQQINLYQAKFRKPRKPLSALEASLGLLVIAVSVLSYSGFLWQRDTRLETEARVIGHDVEVQKGRVERLNQEITERKKDVVLEAAAQRAEQQVADSREVLQVINGGGVGVGVPSGYSEQLRALARQAVNGIWLTGFTFAANADENLIRGRTLNAELVPTYLRRLNEERTLQGQHFDSLTISTPPADTPAATGAAAASASAAIPTGAQPKSQLKFLEFTVGAAQAVVLPKPAVKP